MDDKQQTQQQPDGSVAILFDFPHPAEADIEFVQDDLGRIRGLRITPIVYAARGLLNIAGLQVTVGDKMFQGGLLRLSMSTGRMTFINRPRPQKPKFLEEGLDKAIEREQEHRRKRIESAMKVRDRSKLPSVMAGVAAMKANETPQEADSDAGAN